MTLGLAEALPPALYSGLTRFGVPAAAASQISHLPPTAALFGAFLGYNPIGQLLPPQIEAGLTQADKAALLGKEYFPHIISSPFMSGLHAVFYVSAVLCLIAAGASVMRGKQSIYGQAPVPAASAEETPSAGIEIG